MKRVESKKEVGKQNTVDLCKIRRSNTSIHLPTQVVYGRWTVFVRGSARGTFVLLGALHGRGQQHGVEHAAVLSCVVRVADAAHLVATRLQGEGDGHTAAV